MVIFMMITMMLMNILFQDLIKKQLTHETFCDQSENLGADQMIFFII